MHSIRRALEHRVVEIGTWSLKYGYPAVVFEHPGDASGTPVNDRSGTTTGSRLRESKAIGHVELLMSTD